MFSYGLANQRNQMMTPSNIVKKKKKKHGVYGYDFLQRNDFHVVFVIELTVAEMAGNTCVIIP